MYIKWVRITQERLKISNGLIRIIIDIEVSNMIYRQIINEMLWELKWDVIRIEISTLREVAVSITQHTGQWSVFSPRSAQECDLITGLGSGCGLGTNQATMETMNLTGHAASAALATAPPDNTFYSPLSHQATKLVSSQHASQMSSLPGVYKIN